MVTQEEIDLWWTCRGPQPEGDKMDKKIKEENRRELEARGYVFEEDDRGNRYMRRGSNSPNPPLTGSSFSNPTIKVIPGKMAEHRNRAWM